MPCLKGHNLIYPRPIVIRSPFPSKSALEIALEMRFLAIAYPSSQRNMLPSWLLTVSTYFPFGENTSCSIPNLCPRRIHLTSFFTNSRSSIEYKYAEPCLPDSQTAKRVSSGLTTRADMASDACDRYAIC